MVGNKKKILTGEISHTKIGESFSIFVTVKLCFAGYNFYLRESIGHRLLKKLKDT